ncbi:MAG: 30S ribosomal protein S19 [Candidatus Woesearchaeota archaeon]
MVLKEFKYRGKSLDQLKTMSIKELAGLYTARRRRALTRGLTKPQKIFMKKLEEKKDKALKTHNREMVVLPGMVGRTIRIHRGKDYMAITIIPEMIGHVFGELVMTRKKVEHHAPGVGATKSSGAMGGGKH